MGGGKPPKRQYGTGANNLISNARGIEGAKQVYTQEVVDENKNVRIRVRTYKWDHDGPSDKDDYETIMYFYEEGSDKPKHAITFSHYGMVYHRNLKPWNDEDYSARITNYYHTPVLKSDVEIKGGLTSQVAYAVANLSLNTNRNLKIEPRRSKSGNLPDRHPLNNKVEEIKSNQEEYWSELESD